MVVWCRKHEDIHQVIGKKSHEVGEACENADYREMDPPSMFLIKTSVSSRHSQK